MIDISMCPFNDVSYDADIATISSPITIHALRKLLFHNSNYPYRNKTPGVYDAIVLEASAEQRKVWLITNYYLIKKILLNPDLSIASEHFTEDFYPDLKDFPTRFSKLDHLLSLNAPSHTRLRRLLPRTFILKKLETLKPKVKIKATQLIKHLQHKKQLDFHNEFSRPLVGSAICYIFGIPIEDYTFVINCMTEMISEINISDVIPWKGHDTFQSYLAMLIKQKRQQSDNSLLSILVKHHDEGKLSIQELKGMATLFMVAGLETSITLLTNSVHALLLHPIEWSNACQDLNNIEHTIEELLRFISPVGVSLPRYAKAPIALKDTWIHKGDIVFLGFGLANRDPRVFPDPERLNTTKNLNQRHIAFGYGSHFCLGSAVARAIAEITLKTLATECSDLNDIFDIKKLPSFVSVSGNPPTFNCP